MTLLDMVRDYQSLLEHKEELADEVKANNALIEEAKARIPAPSSPPSRHTSRKTMA